MTGLVQIIKAMHARGGFLGHAFDGGLGFGEETGGFFHALVDLLFDDLFLFRLRNGDDVFTSFGACAEQDIERGVAAIIEDHVRALREHEGFVEVIPMLGQGLALDGEDRDAGGGNGGGGVVLG